MVISFFPKLGEFRIANIGVPFSFSCRAKEGFASIEGDAVRAFFRIGFILVVLAEWRILKKVILLGVVCLVVGRIFILAIRTLRTGLCSK